LRESARGDVIAVARVTTADGQARLLARGFRRRDIRSIQCRPGAGHFSDIDRDRWMQAIEANMIAPLMLIRAVLPGMKERRFGRIVNITSAMVTTPRPHMTVVVRARAGLTAADEGPVVESRATT